MNDEVNYQNHPLHGVSLKTVVTEVVEHYGFEILFAYLNINCFKTNPSIDSSVKFLKKTEWAREKVEGFYMYQFKSLPRASSTQFSIPARDRVIPEHHVMGEPKDLSLEDAQRLQEKRAIKTAEHGKGGRPSSRTNKKWDTARKPSRPTDERKPRDEQSSDSSSSDSSDPWAHWR